jgi:hypothetical protein
MANENKNAPGSQGTGGQKGGQKPGQDAKANANRPDAGRSAGSQSTEKKGYDEERPGYDIDIDTDGPSGGKDASDGTQPGGGERKSGLDYGGAGGRGGRPEVDDPSRSRTTREIPNPDDDRQAKKRQ